MSDDEFDNPELAAAEAELRREGDDAEPILEWERESFLMSQRPNNLDYSDNPDRPWARRSNMRVAVVVALIAIVLVVWLIS